MSKNDEPKEENKLEPALEIIEEYPAEDAPEGENELVQDAPEKSKADIDAMLDSFGKADKNILRSYKYVLFRRQTDLVTHLRKRQDTINVVKNNRSCLSKCGSLLKTLIFYCVIAAVLIPALYEITNKFFDTGNAISDQEFETVNLRDE